METPGDLRAALRGSTSRAHRRLDAAPEQRALLSPGLTLERYAAILARHARAYAACESELAALAGGRPAGLRAYRPRLPALRHDLARLPGGGVDPHPPVPDAGVAGARPDGADVREGRYLGFRYVLDGATQGGIVIAARLERTLPQLREDRFAFWRLQVDEAAAWGDVTQALAARPGGGQMAEAAIAAALEAFDAFLRAFDLAEGKAAAR